MKEIEKYLESQRALDENGKPDESLFGVKMYKSLKAAKISKRLSPILYKLSPNNTPIKPQHRDLLLGK